MIITEVQTILNEECQLEQCERRVKLTKTLENQLEFFVFRRL